MSEVIEAYKNMLRSGERDLIEVAVYSLSYSDCETVAERVLYIRTKVRRDGAWAGRALVRLYNEQTDGEKAVHAATTRNARGFTAFDADFFTGLAEQYIDKGKLSIKQWERVFSGMPKYAAQLEKLTRE